MTATFTAETTRDTTGDPRCPMCHEPRYRLARSCIDRASPESVGGWARWSEELSARLEPWARHPGCDVTVIQPQRSERFVHLALDAVTIEAHASANPVLSGPSRLDGRHERLLGQFGWTPPESSVGAHPSRTTTTWHRRSKASELHELVADVTATLVGVFGFSALLGVEIHLVPRAGRCIACRALRLAR
jgi:hypothetical protein